MSFVRLDVDLSTGGARGRPGRAASHV